VRGSFEAVQQRPADTLASMFVDSGEDTQCRMAADENPSALPTAMPSTSAARSRSRSFSNAAATSE
jgi:hypothetical protein